MEIWLDCQGQRGGKEPFQRKWLVDFDAFQRNPGRPEHLERKRTQCVQMGGGRNDRLSPAAKILDQKRSGRRGVICRRH